MSEQFTKIPTHVAIIMDGNGRWAKARGLTRLEGHHAGTEALRGIIRACVDFEVKYLTVYAFSTENWSRPSDEVNGLMMLLESVVVNELDELDKEGVQIRHIGRLEALPKSLGEKVRDAVVRTSHNDRIILNIAWNYGGRDEIVYAVRQLIAEGIPAEKVTEETISSHLFTNQSPDPDLVIRTSGEYRISNFMIWQNAYSEWFFTPVLWPDFNKEELRKAILEYGHRDRRFGKVSSQQ
jgi:undecaprenyl diphosphate synthase